MNISNNHIVRNNICGSPAGNGRFGASGAVARPKVCADLEVLRPSERQWKPRLRQAAGTLYAMWIGKCDTTDYNVIKFLGKIRNIFVLASLIGVLFFNLICCNHLISEDISDSERNEIDSIIANNNLTIIYLWTEWCDGSRFHFIEDVVPYLQQKSDTIGFISIFYGDKSELESILLETKCDYPIFRIDSRSGFDKIRMYKLLNSFLKDYKRMDYVPVSVICDRNGNILNYNEEKKVYSHIVDCIKGVEAL